MSKATNGAKKPAAVKKPVKKKMLESDNESGSDFDEKPKKTAPKKAAPKKSAPKKAKFNSDESGSDFDMDDVAPARDRPGNFILHTNTSLGKNHSYAMYS